MILKKIFYLITVSCLFTLSNIFAQDELQLIATMTGEKTGDMFNVVAGVGDVNGDGYDDVMVGAPKGKYAKLYFGSTPFDTLADLRFDKEPPPFTFGTSIAGADVNNDGFQDVIIVSAIKVYIYFGGAEMDAIVDVTLSHPIEPFHNNFGHQIANAGDVNGDGFEDIIIGAPTINDYGWAYIFFGDSIMDDQPDVSIISEEINDMFGESVAGVGDINGDGYDDVIIGVPQDDGIHYGKAQLYLGGDPMDDVADLILEGEDIPAYSFGRIVSGLGDINNDGFCDFGVMALPYIKIFLGNENLNAITEIRLIPTRDYWNLASCQDLNKDGFDDFITVSEDTRIFFGSETPDTTYDLLVPHFFKYVSGAGDINKDTDMEIILGERPDNQEKVFVYSYRHGNNVNDFKQIGCNNFVLFQNYPNPFNTNTIISYQLLERSKVTISIYNVVGKKIKEILNRIQVPGMHKILWDAKDESNSALPSGIYLCRVKTEYYSDKKDSKIATKKLILTK
jgi:hypothetical protein